MTILAEDALRRESARAKGLEALDGLEVAEDTEAAEDTGKAEDTRASDEAGAERAHEAVGRRDAELLGTRIQAFAAHIAESTCELLLLVAEFDRREALRWYVGLKSVAHWLAWACSMSLPTAREHVRVARSLERMPRATEEFRAGRLSYSKIREMSRVADLVDEDALLEMARAMTASQLARTVAGFRAADGTRVQQEAVRDARWGVREDGMVEIRALLAPEAGAEVVAALELALEHDGHAPGQDDGAPPRAEAEGPPALGQRRADALLDVARAYSDTAPRDRSGDDRHLVVVHVDAAALARGASAVRHESAGARQRAGIEGLGPIEAATADRLACTGRIALALTGDEGEVLQLGRARRLASPAQRRALRIRWSACCFPGCDQTRHLDAHHVVPWSEGGRTDLDGLALLCRRHHVLVHEGGLHLVPTRDRRGAHADVHSAVAIGGVPVRAPFAVVDAEGRDAAARWPRGLEGRGLEGRGPAPLAAPVRESVGCDADDVDAARIFPTTGGWGFRLADAVTAMLTHRSGQRQDSDGGGGHSGAGGGQREGGEGSGRLCGTRPMSRAA